MDLFKSSEINQFKNKKGEKFLVSSYHMLNLLCLHCIIAIIRILKNWEVICYCVRSCSFMKKKKLWDDLSIYSHCQTPRYPLGFNIKIQQIAVFFSIQNIFSNWNTYYFIILFLKKWKDIYPKSYWKTWKELLCRTHKTILAPLDLPSF